MIFFSHSGLKKRRSYLTLFDTSGNFSWMWWIFILRFSQFLCEPSFHYMEILLTAIKIGPVVEMLTCKGTSFNWKKVVLLLIDRDQLLSIIGDYTVCCVCQKTKTWWLDASPLKQRQTNKKQNITTKHPSTLLAYLHHRLIHYQIGKGKLLLRPVSDRHSSVRNGNAIDTEVL